MGRNRLADSTSRYRRGTGPVTENDDFPDLAAPCTRIEIDRLLKSVSQSSVWPEWCIGCPSPYHSTESNERVALIYTVV